jgi:hypothetical protein
MKYDPNHQFETSNQFDIPGVYFGASNPPGIYIHWDRSGATGVVSTVVMRSKQYDGDYESIGVVAWPVNEFIDPDGSPADYYLVQDLDNTDTVLNTSQPIQGEALLIKASLAYQIKDLLRVNIYDEDALFSSYDRTWARLTFPNWNYWPRPEIRINSHSDFGASSPMIALSENNTILRTIDGSTNDYADGLKYKLDYQGRVYFLNSSNAPISLQEYNYILATYNVRLFTGVEMNSALNLALQSINAQAGVSKVRFVAQAPIYWDAALIAGATYYLLRSLLTRLTNRETRMLIQDPDDKFIDDLRQTAKMYKEDFDALMKAIPTSRYPYTTAVVTPEYVMPGGRSRMFRYMWQGGGI